MKISRTELDQLVKDEYVKRIPDPEGSPLSIYNYTFKASIEDNWSPLLLACRGLVVGDTDDVVYGRPFRKFFNIDEHATTKRSVLPKETPQLAEKLDGSLVSIFFDPFKNKWRCTTRGCWDNVQTLWVRRGFLDVGWPNYMQGDRHGTLDEASRSNTYCFELIAPWNRVVVAYSTAKIVLLGVIDNETGKETDYIATGWFARERSWHAVKYSQEPIESVDLDAKFKNDEGFVACYSNGLRVKLKYRQYCEIHRVVTGLSVKGVWESLQSGNIINKDNLPDEFLKWYEAQVEKFTRDFERVELKALRTYVNTDSTLSRKEKALLWKDQDKIVQSILFCLLDKRPYDEVLWKWLKPSSSETFKVD